MVKHGLLFLGILASVVQGYEGCTVAVISAQATVDGRPLLWKNRDSSFRENEVAFFRGVRHDFLGVINAGDTTQVWMGVNTAGLAIMNAESMDQPGDSADTEGFFMKQVLAECGRLQDVETLLRQTNLLGRGTRANFGCIDAFGGAALYETGNRSFVCFDVNDPLIAPDGFLVRANFSMTGRQDRKGQGPWRYQRARTLLQKPAGQRVLSFEYLLQTVCRDLVTEEVNPYPLPFTGSMDGAPSGWVCTQNSINRHRTVSCAIFHGVKPGEPPLLTTLWCLLGEPLCSIAVPLWAGAGPVDKALDGKHHSALNRTFQRKHARLYHDKKNPDYLDSRRLVGDRSFTRRQIKIEQEILADTQRALARWRQRLPAAEELAKFQNDQLSYVVRRY